MFGSPSANDAVQIQVSNVAKVSPSESPTASPSTSKMMLIAYSSVETALDADTFEEYEPVLLMKSSTEPALDEVNCLIKIVNEPVIG